MEPSNPPAAPAWPFVDDRAALASPYPGGEDRHTLAPMLLQNWQTAVRWRLLIAGIIVAALAAGFIITMLTAPQYTAGSRIQLTRAGSNVAEVGADPYKNYYDDQFFDTQYALLKAPSLAERVARNLRLADDPSFFAAHGVKAGVPEPGSPANAAQRRARERTAAGLLLTNVSIVPVTHSDLVEIKYTSRSPQLSARIANAWPQEYVGANMDRQYATTGDARRFLEERLESLRGRLNESENALISFANAQNIVKIGGVRDAQGRTSEPETLVASNLVALNSALVQARTERIAAQSRARGVGNANIAEANESSTIAALRARRAELAADYAKILTQFEPGYGTAKATKSQIDVIDAAIARETSRLVAARQSNFAEAAQREKELAAQVDGLKSQFDQQQRDTIRYNLLQREVDTNRQLYDALLQRYKEIGVAGAVGSTNIVLVDRAEVPQSPASPNLMQNLLIALIAGLVLAAATVLALEQIDETIHNPSDVEKLLRLPVLGAVPFVEDLSPELLSDSRSHLSESYFSVWTALALATSHGFPRSLLVTSAQPGEGKSVTSLSLAIAAGRAGMRVLLIDGDMRKPTLDDLLGLPNEHGLSNLLSGEEFRPGLIQESKYRGVSLLPSGPKPPSASELLAGPRIAGLVQTLASQYDAVIIDGPPVVGLADAPLLGAVVESCVFVTQANKMAIRTIRNSLQRLRSANTRLIGAVVTKLDLDRDRYGYGYSYEYGSERPAQAVA